MMVEIKETKYNKCLQEITATGTLTHFCMRQNGRITLENSLNFFLKVNTLLQYGPGIQPLSICSMKANVYAKSRKEYL